MDFTAKIQELFRMLRAQLRSSEISAELGFTYNIFSRWESGTRKVHWADLVSLCNYRAISLQNVLENNCNLNVGDATSGSEIAKYFLETFSPTVSLVQHISAQKLRRLASGETQLALNDFLVLLEVTTGRSERFISLILPDDPHRRTANRLLRDYASLAENYPIAAAVHSYLRLHEYRQSPQHDDLQIATALGLDILEVANVIQKLVAYGTIERRDQHFVDNLSFVDLRAANRKETSRTIHRHWRNEISKSLDEVGLNPSPRVKSAYLIYETDEVLNQKLFELSNRFYLEFCSLVKNHAGKDFTDLKFMNIEFFNMITPIKSIIQET